MSFLLVLQMTILINWNLVTRDFAGNQILNFMVMREQEQIVFVLYIDLKSIVFVLYIDPKSKGRVLMLVVRLILVVILLFGIAASASAEKYFVVFKEAHGPSERALVRRAVTKSVVRGRRGDPSSDAPGKIRHIYRIVPAMAVEMSLAEVKELRKNSKVDRIVIDHEIFSGDAELENTWGVEHIGAGIAHDGGTTGAGVKVAVIDSGINYNHTDLDDNYAGGYDFVNWDNDPLDDNGHGTHVAGTIAAEDNGAGVVGVAPGVSLYALKVLNSAGSGNYSNVIAALQWCIDNGMDIANHSYYSIIDPGSLVEDAYTAAYNVGILHVACAGNEGNVGGTGDNVGYPANFARVIAVAATKLDDTRPSFSSTGPNIELSAPGVGIKSTLYNGGYGNKSGTSMASPHVVGLAALILEDNPGWSPGQIRSNMRVNATDLGIAGVDDLYGYGLVVAGVPQPADPSPVPPEPDPEPDPEPPDSGNVPGPPVPEDVPDAPEPEDSPGDSVPSLKTIPFETYSSIASRGTVTLLRSSAILTNNYVSTDYIVLYGHTDIGLLVELTKGSLTSVEYKLWFSYNGVDWFQQMTMIKTATTRTLASSNQTIDISGLGATILFYTSLPNRADYFKLDIKGTGTVSGSLCAVNLVGRIQ